MRDIDITSLRLFIAVCEARSIARAGEQANIVGSAISKRLAQLEDTVGTPLLIRHRRLGVEPTPAGVTMLEHARAVVASLGRIERDMAAYAAGVRGQVRILATSSTVAESLPEDVAAFLKDPAHRDIQVNIEEQVSMEVLRSVREGSASVGICWDAADFSQLQSVPYRHDHLSVVVHPEHPLAQRHTLRFDEALDYEHVGLPGLSAVQIMLHRAAAVIGKPLKYRATVSTFDAALRVVNANLAISVIPREIAQPYADTMGLRVIALNERWAVRRFAICYQDAHTLSPASKLLVDYLVDVAGSAAAPQVPAKKAAHLPRHGGKPVHQKVQ